MQLLTTKQIKLALEERWQVEKEEAGLIAALAAGRMGWAVQAVEDEDMLADRQAQLETLAKLSTAGRVERFEVAQRLSTESEKLSGILELWLLWWRDIVLAANNCLDLIVNRMREDEGAGNSPGQPQGSPHHSTQPLPLQ